MRRPAPSETIFLQPNDKFALGADDLQWILYRRSGDRWCGISYVRSSKEILLRCVCEAGCKPVQQAQAALEGMPTTFDAWKAVKARRIKGPLLDMPVPSVFAKTPGIVSAEAFGQARITLHIG